MTSEYPIPSKIMRMNSTQLMLFIELYKQHECLWNRTHEEYPHKYKRRRAAAEIADKMGIKGFTAHHVILKFKNLRNVYSQERKRIASSEELVARGKAKKVHETTLCWFNIMDSFIRPHILQKTAPTNAKPKRKKKTSQKEVYETRKMECDVQDHIGVTYNNNTQQITIESSENEASNDTHSKRQGVSNTEPRDQELEESFGRHELKEEPAEQDDQVQSTSTDFLLENEGDFYQCFGKYVASLLSKMPPQKALDLQPKILGLIFSHFEEN